MKTLKLLGTLGLLFTFWPILRIGGLAIFDVIAPIATLVIYAMGKPKVKLDKTLRWAILGISLLFLSSLPSSLITYNVDEHFIRVIKLIIALAAMMAFSCALISRGVFSLQQILIILSISSSLSSGACILQGEFGLLLNLTPELAINDMTRYTGLAEHPIEAGYIAVFGIIFGLALLFNRQDKLVPILFVLINLYSMRYSGSLTAFFALIVGVVVLCVYSKTYKYILLLGLLAPAALFLVFVDNAASPLAKRITQISEVGKNYGTLQSRQNQWSRTIDALDIPTIALGQGYSTNDLPGGDIHNGILASIYHFGLMGFLSQICFFIFFLRNIRKQSTSLHKGVLASALFVFLAAYMTGPPFSRRSLWMPLLLVSTAFCCITQKVKAPTQSMEKIHANRS